MSTGLINLDSGSSGGGGGGGVTSLNSLTGALVLAAGSNITITPSGGTTFTFAAAGPPAFTAGSVPFGNGTGLTEDNTQFFWNDTLHRLGIGTGVPGYVLDIINGDGAHQYATGGVNIQQNQQAGVASLTFTESTFGSAQIALTGHTFTPSGAIGIDEVYIANFSDNGGSTGNLSLLALNSTGSLRFFTGPDDLTANIRMLINPAGNVGIGTITPNTTLQVSATGGANATVLSNNVTSLTGNSLPLGINSVIGKARALFYNNGSLYSAVGYDLSVNAAVFSNFNYNVSDYGLKLGDDGSFLFQDAATITPVLSALANGNIGIGTASPNTVLQITGAATGSATTLSSNLVTLTNTAGQGALGINTTGINSYIAYYLNGGLRAAIGFNNTEGLFFGNYNYSLSDNGFQMKNDGSFTFMDPAAGTNILTLSVAGIATLTRGLNINTAGSGLAVKTGSNAKCGNATLIAGSVTVSNTSITSLSHIHVTIKTPGGTVTGAPWISSVTVGTGFTITGSNALDTSVIGYDIIEEI